MRNQKLEIGNWNFEYQFEEMNYFRRKM